MDEKDLRKLLGPMINQDPSLITLFKKSNEDEFELKYELIFM